MTGAAGEEARALHKSDFAIDGRSIMIGPMAPQYVKRLEALASLLKRDDLGNLSSATRAKVSLPPTCLFSAMPRGFERWRVGHMPPLIVCYGLEFCRRLRTRCAVAALPLSRHTAVVPNCMIIFRLNAA